MPRTPDASPFHRVVVYYQTQISSNKYFSPAPLMSLATHLIIAAFHLNDDKTIHLNNDPPDDPCFTQMWIDVARLQASGIKIMGMLGGAGDKGFQALSKDHDFEDFYELLSSCIKDRRLDGIDLDVEVFETLPNIQKLIKRLKGDFGRDFIITLAPVASALSGGSNLSGFSYSDLEKDCGGDIDWYNAQFYSNFGSMSTTTDYVDIITKLPLDPSRLVAITLANRKDGYGWVPLDDVKATLRQLLRKYGESFGGIAAWEYYNSEPDTKEPWTWAALMKMAMVNWKDVETYNDRVTKQAADEGAKNGSNSLESKAAQIRDGFYQIMQYNDAGKPLAAMPTKLMTTLVSSSTLPVVMGSETGIIGRFFKLTRQFGVVNEFTIVPVDSDIPQSDPVEGLTTTNISDKLNIKRSASYPLWVLRCDESATISSNGTVTTVDYFRVLEVGSNKCWKTGSAATNPPISLSTVSTSARPPQDELYEIVRSDVEKTLNVNSVQNLIVKATSAEVVRKVYISNGVLPAGEADKIISLQLFTDGHDQGWATYPQLGLYSWFEIAILTKDLKPGDSVTTDQIKKVDGKLLTYVSHNLPLTATYTEQEGPVFAKDHELLKHIGATDVIAVLACAQFPQWVCDVRRGDLKIRELVYENDN